MRHKITISGLLRTVEYCSKSLKWNDNYFVDFQWRRLEKITVDDGDEDIKSQRGPWYETAYFHELFKDHPLPVKLRMAVQQASVDYYIECDEFTPSKLQLIHSEREIDAILVVTGAYDIIYDGQTVRGELEAEDYPIKRAETAVVESFK